MATLEIEKLPEFDNHKLVTFVFNPQHNLKGFIAIHRGSQTVPSLGATRLWAYQNETDALRDALRLSRLMSYKSAMAGLKYGGAKAALIATPSALKDRNALFKAYAKHVNDLKGQFITGTDVGVSDDDVRLMRQETPFVIGSKVDPALYTGLGVFYGILATLKELFGSDRTSNRSFAIQGVGKTGSNVLEQLYKSANKIFIADVDEHRLKEIKKQFPKVKVVAPAEIHKQEVDVFVPCALSGVLNSQSVSELRCKIVAGSANNQLADEHIGELLLKLGILYAPDYVINAGGIISVVDELEHEMPNDERIIERVSKINKTLQAVFDRSRKQSKATNIVANEMAEKIFNSHR